MLRRLARVGVPALAALALSVPASAQVVQGFQIGAGGFFPKGIDARTSGDVLVTDLNTFFFNFKHFEGGQIFGEYDVDLGKHIEVGAGVGYYRRTTPSVYASLVNQNGNEIRQDLRLRTVPVSVVVRFMPFGKPGHVQPYVGAGVAAVNWRYSEFGEFVDDSNNIFRASFVGTGTSPAGILLGGVRFPTRGDVFGLTLELRYQWGRGNLNPNDFFSNRIDLGGMNFTAGFQVRY